MANENDATAIPCCPDLMKDDHCDVINFSRVLTYPTGNNENRRRVNVEVILHFKLTRCTLGLTLGDPAYSTTLLPGEKVRLSTTDRRSRFTYDSETKLSYRSEQISEEQYFMTATQKYLADASAAQSGNAESSSEGKWDFHGDAGGSINPFTLSASASTSAGGSHNSSSVSDYLNQQKSHVQSSASQAVSATRKAHSISIGEVSSRTHIQGESEDHFEAASREFSNHNKCHAVTYMFYRINKKQKINFELVAIERRVADSNAPIGGILQPAAAKLPIALVPQDIPATNLLRRTTVAASATAFANIDTAFLLNVNQTLNRSAFATEQNFGIPLDEATRMAALKEVDQQLIAKNLLGKDGKVSQETKLSINFDMEFSLPTPGIVVKGCLDDCDTCEPLVKERMQLENDLLRKQIELLEKSQEYRCCPVASTDTDN
ncbi:MAG: hypothetical protein JWR61_11 [Ferruginibacter sp.]|uniref:hypothetical protein n=1 Tax=Ferruginibacter sp. TaxID=1940288 RepID=UPI002658792F|nr:hypothetical protein [Ferruginibacter sp.]MDB5275056.1 hypothetical protein [Ferruginibacter sp.]